MRSRTLTGVYRRGKTSDRGLNHHEGQLGSKAPNSQGSRQSTQGGQDPELEIISPRTSSWVSLERHPSATWQIGPFLRTFATFLNEGSWKDLHKNTQASSIHPTQVLDLAQNDCKQSI